MKIKYITNRYTWNLVDILESESSSPIIYMHIIGYISLDCCCFFSIRANEESRRRQIHCIYYPRAFAIQTDLQSEHWNLPVNIGDQQSRKKERKRLECLAVWL